MATLVQVGFTFAPPLPAAAPPLPGRRFIPMTDELGNVITDELGNPIMLNGPMAVSVSFVVG